MQRLFVPTLGPTDWRRLLVDPLKQWEPDRSALEMAVCWESARDDDRGLPLEVRLALDATPALADAALVIGLPEHAVEFDGVGRPSHNDLWALLRTPAQFVSLSVEAKAGESLAELVEDWLENASKRSAKRARLAGLQALLGNPDTDVGHLRYQLLHRTVSALVEAARFRTGIAAMLVQSFNRKKDSQSWDDFCRFGEIMQAEVAEGRFVRAEVTTSVPLYLGWVSCEPADRDRLRAAV
jgi:hypothetical protein